MYLTVLTLCSTSKRLIVLFELHPQLLKLYNRNEAVGVCFKLAFFYEYSVKKKLNIIKKEGTVGVQALPQTLVSLHTIVFPFPICPKGTNFPLSFSSLSFTPRNNTRQKEALLVPFPCYHSITTVSPELPHLPILPHLTKTGIFSHEYM